MSKAAASKKDSTILAASSPLKTAPYTMLVCKDVSPHGTPLYLVAGSPAPAAKADKALRTAFALHGGVCHYCKKSIDELTIDHVEPASAGGKDLLHNLVIACKPCNASKGNLAIDVFEPEAGREWLTALLKQIEDRLNRL